MYRSCVRILDGRWVWHESRWRSWGEGRVPAGRQTSSAGRPPLPRFPRSSSGLWAAQKHTMYSNVFKTVGVTVILFFGGECINANLGGKWRWSLVSWNNETVDRGSVKAAWSRNLMMWFLQLTWCFSLSDWGQKESHGQITNYIWSTVFAEEEMWYVQWTAGVWFFFLTYRHHHNHHLSLWPHLCMWKHQEGINVSSYLNMSIYVRQNGSPHTWVDSCCCQSIPAKLSS